jgi:hypothetical protein
MGGEMKRILYLVPVIACAVALLVGCRSTAIKPSAAAPVPAAFVTAPAISQGEASSLVTFTRDSGGISHTRWIIYFDSQPIVHIGKGETVTMKLPLGQHILGIEPDAALKVLQVASISQQFIAGRHYFLRAMFTGQDYRLQQTDSSGDIR